MREVWRGKREFFRGQFSHRRIKQFSEAAQPTGTMRTVTTAADLLTGWYVCAEPRVAISKHAQLTSIDNETLKPNLASFLIKQKPTVFDKPYTNRQEARDQKDSFVERLVNTNQ